MKIIKIWLIIILITINLVAQSEEKYGWSVPHSSLNIGSYLDMTYDTHNNPSFMFDDIALLVSGNKHNFDFLAEVEFSHITLDGKSNGSRDINLNIERVQLSYALSDTELARLGRFNSEVGFWNLAPIPILEDTISQPYFMGRVFPRYVVGGMYEQELNSEHKLSLTLQNSEDFVHKGSSVEAKQHLLLSYYGEKEDLSWNVALGKYENLQKDDFNYVGVALAYEGENIDLQSELYLQDSQSNYRIPYSGYVQGTWHFLEKKDIVARIGSYKENALNLEENIYLLGYVYRPNNKMALKAEYIEHSLLPLNHFVYSFSVLF